MAATRSPQPKLHFPSTVSAARRRGTLIKHSTVSGAVPDRFPDEEKFTNLWTVPTSNQTGWLDHEPVPPPLAPEEWMNDIYLRSKGIEAYPAHNEVPRMGPDTKG